LRRKAEKKRGRKGEEKGKKRGRKGEEKVSGTVFA
jgi:hypothetical protein